MITQVKNILGLAQTVLTANEDLLITIFCLVALFFGAVVILNSLLTMIMAIFKQS